MDFHSPSWSDAVHATVGSCLSCFRQSSGDSADEAESFNRRPPRHLESLLTDVQDTDTEAETVSLHSNVGDSQAARRRRQRKKKRASGARSISLFGFDLFGKRTGAIRLPDSDEEEDRTNGDDGASRRRQRGQRHQSGQSNDATGNTRSSSRSLTFDSDATSLDPAVIDDLTPEQLEERARLAEAEAIEARARAEAAEVERRREKEERRRKRRERKELKRMAEAMARNDNGTGEFEGFQGSADALPPGYMQPQPVPGFVYEYDEHGRLYQLPPQMPHPSNPQLLVPVDQQVPSYRLNPEADVEADEAVDLGGGLYAGRKRDYRNRATGGSSAGDSDSRSRTSASRSETSNSQVASSAGYHHPSPFQQYPEQQQGYPYPHPHPAYIQHPQYPQGQFDPNQNPLYVAYSQAQMQNPQQPYSSQAPLSLPALQALEVSGGKKKKKSSSKSKSSKSSETSSVSHTSHNSHSNSSHTSQSQSLQSPPLASPASGAFLPSLPLATSEEQQAKSQTNSTVTTPLVVNDVEVDELDELDEFGVDPDRVGGDAVLVEAPSYAFARGQKSSTSSPSPLNPNFGSGLRTPNSDRGFPSPGLPSPGLSIRTGNGSNDNLPKDKGFPSTGFGRSNSQRSGMSGAFLANLGNDNGKEREREQRGASSDMDI
ncbi:hypothetical protein D9758_006928 [Tetrapyrgos nigripes]|uniref:Uncharacterized protein n=1 Tax=Tetrapyrgos nigripes TaxID=182062 RepID=A0A8H5LU96_9AGAR|nr:hypothetical protein D9758_006928 [Tetrapyrgos nigripes]